MAEGLPRDMAIVRASESPNALIRAGSSGEQFKVARMTS
jgi:hypothetical protein